MCKTRAARALAALAQPRHALSPWLLLTWISAPRFPLRYSSTAARQHGLIWPQRTQLLRRFRRPVAWLRDTACLELSTGGVTPTRHEGLAWFLRKTAPGAQLTLASCCANRFATAMKIPDVVDLSLTRSGTYDVRRLRQPQHACRCCCTCASTRRYNAATLSLERACSAWPSSWQVCA